MTTNQTALISHESETQVVDDGGLGQHGQYRSIDSLRMYYVDRGSGDVVLLLHGIPTFSYLWRDVTPVIARSHRVIAPDLPGFGYSDKPRDRTYSVATSADAVERLLGQLDIERVALVGHDFGALVAAELVARDPTRIHQLVFLNTSLRPQAWFGATPLAILRLPLVGESAMALSRKWMLKVAMRFYVSRAERLTSEVMDHYWWPFEHGFRDVLLQLYRSTPFAPEDFERWREALRRISAPALIAWGAQDPSFGVREARDVARLLPGAEVHLFAHANHFLPEDRPLALGRLISTFLASEPVG